MTEPGLSPDGKKLTFTSNRSGNSGGIDYDVWMVWLNKEDWERSKADRENGDYYKAKEADKKKERFRYLSMKKEFLTDSLGLQDFRHEYGGMFGPDSEYVYYSATDPSTNNRSFLKLN